MKVSIGPSSFAAVDQAPLALLENNGLEVVSNPCSRKLTEHEIIHHLKGVDGLLAGLEPLNANVLQKCSQLKAIARVGVGMENVDVAAAQKLSIKVSNTPEGPIDAVAEMTLAAALALSRSIFPANDSLHRKQWKKSISIGLKNSNILIIGHGRIGQRVAELFRGFGAHIMICDPLVRQDDLQHSEGIVDLKEGLKSADIISLHADGNEPILTESEFHIMQDGVIVLNSARANLIDETTLFKALDSGRVASAWLDVFSEEPYTGRLTEYQQVLLTPHISTYTIQCRRDMEIAAVNNLLRDLEVGQ